MPDNTLTIALEGDVSLNQFRETLNRFTNLVFSLAREVAPGIDIDWLIDDLQAGSAIATIVGLAQEEEPVIRVVRSYGKIGNALEHREPIPFSSNIVREAKALTEVIGGNIVSVRFMTAESDSIIYGAFDLERTISLMRRTSFGVVKGKVQTVSNRGKLKFTLYDSTFDKAVPCYLQEGQEDLMREIWGKSVIISGRITREPDNGRPISVREITSIDPLIVVDPGSYKIARGILATENDTEPAEVSIRRLRDAEN